MIGEIPAQTQYIIKIGEISLKGKNQHLFLSRLKKNVLGRLQGINVSIYGNHGRYFLSADKEHEDIISDVLSKTFGIVAFGKVNRIKKDIGKITERAILLSSEIAEKRGTFSFKIEARRSDKSFPLDSYEIACSVGQAVLDAVPGASVDVNNPDWTLHVEIRDSAVVYGTPNPGPGGLPEGIAGKGLLMLSGGIDSPVSGYMMKKRGLWIDAVYFHAYPYTSDKAKEKVIRLAKLLGRYSGRINLFVVPFTQVQLMLKEKCREEEITLLMRACMIRISEMIAEKIGASCLITGEALSQVASQTLASIRFTNTMTNLPIFRPLIGMDKEEIIDISRKIGAFDISILPYEDCCTLFSPKHPITNPRLEKMEASFHELSIENELREAADSAEIHKFLLQINQGKLDF